MTPWPGRGNVDEYPIARSQGDTMELTTPMSRPAGPPGELLAFERPAARTRAAIRLLLAHEDGLARAGLWALLEREPDITVVGEVSRGDEAVAVGCELCSDILLMSLPRPGLDALQATRRLVAAGACPQVLVLGSAGSDEELFG